MDELLRALSQLQEELKRTISANEMIEAAKLASERIAPIITKLDALLKELNEVNFPQTLKDLKEIVYSTNRAVDDVKDGVKDNKRFLEQLVDKIGRLKDQMILFSDNQTSLIDHHFNELNISLTKEITANKKKQHIIITLEALILVTVILLTVLFLMR